MLKRQVRVMHERGMKRCGNRQDFAVDAACHQVLVKLPDRVGGPTEYQLLMGIVVSHDHARKQA